MPFPIRTGRRLGPDSGTRNWPTSDPTGRRPAPRHPARGRRSAKTLRTGPHHRLLVRATVPGRSEFPGPVRRALGVVRRAAHGDPHPNPACAAGTARGDRAGEPAHPGPADRTPAPASPPQRASASKCSPLQSTSKPTSTCRHHRPGWKRRCAPSTATSKSSRRPEASTATFRAGYGVIIGGGGRALARRVDRRGWQPSAEIAARELIANTLVRGSNSRPRSPHAS